MNVVTAHLDGVRAVDAAVLPRTLKFGHHRTTLRTLQPDDEQRLIEFFESHSADTVHQRYGYQRGSLTSKQAALLVGVDQTRDVALGVFERRVIRSELIAVGRYCLATGGQSAEVAFVVREDRRKLGIATSLFRALIAIARERKLLCLTALVQASNHPMLATFRRQGALLTDSTEPGAMDMALDLSHRERIRG
jgi:GNAT superfamily N-acetyltransferase